MSKVIRIVNPASDCCFTSKNRANRFVKSGRAEWMEPGLSIRFLEADHRHRSVRRSVEGTALSYDLAACTGMARLGDLANTPVVPAALLLGLGRRKGASRHTFLATQGI
jgi:hypothetical protein